MSQPASPNAASTVTRRNPKSIWDSTANGHSQISVAEAGRLAFLSGQVAVPAHGAASPRDLPGQAKLVAANLSAALGDLGASSRDVVLLRIYIVDATKDRFLEAWSPIRDMLGGELPSVTAIGVQALYTSALELEVEMVVRCPDEAT